mgnify:CR=1 FL=1
MGNNITTSDLPTHNHRYGLSYGSPNLPGLAGGSGVNQGATACSNTLNPAGVTTARFQIWGAGGGSSGSCAANFSFGTPGSTGAYASVILPVVPGCIYCLCAGCAMCCLALAQGIGGLDGCEIGREHV